MNTFPETSPRNFRTPNANTRKLWDAIIAIINEYDRMSVRQLFYQLVARGHVEKTERAYKRVADAAVQIRLSGVLPYRKIVDGHRERRRTLAYNGIEEALERTANLYRRNYWTSQPHYVEVWSEKDALSGIILPICDEYGVTYVASRGFPSLTIRYESAQEFIRVGKPVTVFYFGDHDASGRAISDNLEAELRQHGADVRVIRQALEPDQIQLYGLPTRPGKTTDTRHAAFAEVYGDASVELDALPPDVLSSIVRSAIESEIDMGEWDTLRDIERMERMTLASLSGNGF
jgi:hypothetical protein